MRQRAVSRKVVDPRSKFAQARIEFVDPFPNLDQRVIPSLKGGFAVSIKNPGLESENSAPEST
jgi:hypothetical protein